MYLRDWTRLWEWNRTPFVQLCANKIQRVISTLLLLLFPSRDCRSSDFIRSQLVLILPSWFALINCRLCWLVLWECGWANPRFMLPVKKGGWLRVLFVRLYKLSLLAASYPAVLQLVVRSKILRHEDQDLVTYQVASRRPVWYAWCSGVAVGGWASAVADGLSQWQQCISHPRGPKRCDETPNEGKTSRRQYSRCEVAKVGTKIRGTRSANWWDDWLP